LKIVIDLDGTVLFAEERPQAVMIKGRRRNSFVAAETLESLQGWEIIIATGRSISSALSIKAILEERGLKIIGVVAENGGAIITQDTKTLTSLIWQEEMNILQAKTSVHLSDFSTCLALLKPSQEELLEVRSFLSQDHYLLQDDNKTFIYEKGVGKRQALEGLLGDELLSCCGMGNDINDLDWLEVVGIPASPGGVIQEVESLVLSRQGIVAINKGHDSIPEIIEIMKSRILSRLASEMDK
jgi:hydroxymethylpyrimidine pyrophosphatase-like HAD family hydrolase